MSFMQKQIVLGKWVEVDTDMGVWYIPADIVPQTVIDFCNDENNLPDETSGTVRCELLQFTECYDANQINEVAMIEGYGARMIAPGYIDCTDWTVFETEQEAEDYLDEYYAEAEADD